MVNRFSKYLAVVLALTLVFSVFVGCSSNKDGAVIGGADSASDIVVTENKQDEVMPEPEQTPASAENTSAETDAEKEPETKIVYVNRYTTKTVVQEVEKKVPAAYSDAYLVKESSASLSQSKSVFTISSDENGKVGVIADGVAYSLDAPDGLSLDLSEIEDELIYILFDKTNTKIEAHGSSSLPVGDFASVAILQPSKNQYYGANEVSFGKSLLQLLEGGCRIKLLGDSITAGAGSSDDDRTTSDVFMTIGKKEYRRQLGKLCFAGRLSDYMSEKFGCTVVNNGISGITSTVLRREMPKLTDEADEVVFLMVGSNNRSSETGMTRLYDDLTYMVTSLKSQGKTVVLMSPTPPTIESDGKASHIFHTEDVANVISLVADEQDVTFVDNYNYVQNFVAASGISLDELMVADGCLSDGLHPTDAVHNMIFKNILQTVGLAPKTDGASW